MPNKNFYRKIEDFKCYNCNFLVNGNGYTDHCPKCLSSKHVDIHPGDRLSTCMGNMLPFQSTYKNGQFTIYYECLKCHIKKKVKAASNDNNELLMTLSSKVIN
jgi:hypothetical protein